MVKASANKIEMGHGPILPALIRFAVPLALANVMNLLFLTADMVVIGRFGKPNALGAVAHERFRADAAEARGPTPLDHWDGLRRRGPVVRGHGVEKRPEPHARRTLDGRFGHVGHNADGAFRGGERHIQRVGRGAG